MEKLLRFLMKKVFRRKKKKLLNGGNVFFLFIYVKHFCFLLIFVINFNMNLKKKPPINFDNTGYVLNSAKQRGKNNTCLNITYNYAFFV